MKRIQTDMKIVIKDKVHMVYIFIRFAYFIAHSTALKKTSKSPYFSLASVQTSRWK